MSTGCLRALGGIEPLTTAEKGKSKDIHELPLLCYFYTPIARAV